MLTSTNRQRFAYMDIGMHNPLLGGRAYAEEYVAWKDTWTAELGVLSKTSLAVFSLCFTYNIFYGPPAQIDRRPY